jgi:hypothetical protein
MPAYVNAQASNVIGSKFQPIAKKILQYITIGTKQDTLLTPLFFFCKI